MSNDPKGWESIKMYTQHLNNKIFLPITFTLTIFITGCVGSPFATMNMTEEEFANSIERYDLPRLCEAYAKIVSGECKRTKEALTTGYCNKAERAIEIILTRRGNSNACKQMLSAQLGLEKNEDKPKYEIKTQANPQTTRENLVPPTEKKGTQAAQKKTSPASDSKIQKALPSLVTTKDNAGRPVVVIPNTSIKEVHDKIISMSLQDGRRIITNYDSAIVISREMDAARKAGYRFSDSFLRGVKGSTYKDEITYSLKNTPTGIRVNIRLDTVKQTKFGQISRYESNDQEEYSSLQHELAVLIGHP